MANLKLDLQNRLNNQKFFAELELVRLAQEPAMNYELKIEQMDVQLQQLAVVNAKIGLVDQYFQEPVSVWLTNTSKSLHLEHRKQHLEHRLLQQHQHHQRSNL